MSSPVFSDAKRQLTLPLDESLLTRHRNVRDCIGQGVYQRGLTWVAGKLNESPGNLSSMLSDDSQRKFGVDELELYIEKTGDKTPIYYLIARFLGDEAAGRDHALGQVVEMLATIQQQLPQMMNAAGLPAAPTARKGGR